MSDGDGVLSHDGPLNRVSVTAGLCEMSSTAYAQDFGGRVLNGHRVDAISLRVDCKILRFVRRSDPFCRPLFEMAVTGIRINV